MDARKLKIKNGDTVEVIAGAEKGKKGAVLHVNRNTLKIRVQGIRVQTHFDKKDGKTEKEGYFDYSNVKLIQKAEPKKKKASAQK